MSHTSPNPTESPTQGGPGPLRTRANPTYRSAVPTAALTLIAAAHAGWTGTVGSTRRHMSGLRPLQVVGRTVVFGSAAIVASGVGHALFHPVRDESRETARMVASMIHERATLDLVPTSFDAELGYEPVVEVGVPVNPNGGCSTPGQIGPGSFATACRTHDLGYDMLRFAEVTDARLGAWARLGLDRRLYGDLLRTCATVTCRATATVYFTAVTANSIRQGYVAPMAEPTMPWVGVALSVVGLAMVTAPGGIDGPPHGTGRGERLGQHRRWRPSGMPYFEPTHRSPASPTRRPGDSRLTGMARHLPASAVVARRRDKKATELSRHNTRRPRRLADGRSAGSTSAPPSGGHDPACPALSTPGLSPTWSGRSQPVSYT